MVGNAGAAREGDLTIHDERFSVGAIVEPSQRVPADRVVPRDLTSSCFERLEDFGTNARRTDRVEQNLDAAACFRSLRERFGKNSAYFSSPIDVRLYRDRVSGSLDGREHRWIKGVAVVQQLETVAIEKRTSAGTSDRPNEFRRVDRELVIETESRRHCGRRDQIAHHGHRTRTDRPAPPSISDRPDAHTRPGPP